MTDLAATSAAATTTRRDFAGLGLLFALSALNGDGPIADAHHGLLRRALQQTVRRLQRFELEKRVTGAILDGFQLAEL